MRRPYETWAQTSPSTSVHVAVQQSARDLSNVMAVACLIWMAVAAYQFTTLLISGFVRMWK